MKFKYVCELHQPAVLFHEFSGMQGAVLSIESNCSECHHAGRQELKVALRSIELARDELAVEKREAVGERQAGAS